MLDVTANRPLSVQPLGDRLLPALDEENRAFWTGGGGGSLMINRCASCGRYVHPPGPYCPYCESTAVEPTAVSGRGLVYSFTVNVHQWSPRAPAPYIIVVVSLDEQADVRITSNLIECDPSDVRIGMPVQVCFEDHGEIWLPLFRPAAPQ